MNLKEQRAAALKAAQDIVAKAKDESRDLTAEEITEVETKTAEIRRIDSHIAAGDRSAALVKSIGGMAEDEVGWSRDGNVPTVANGRVLALTGAGAKAHAAQIASKALAAARGYGTKAVLETGSVVTPVPLQTRIITDGKVPTSLLEILPVTVRSGPTYRYLRQTVRTNHAAIVAPGATKPTSIFTLEEVDGKLEVFAHLSEPIDKYLLSDTAELSRFIETEMLYGLNLAVEDEALNGDGSPGHLSGILDHAVQTQAFSVDMVTSLRAAITKLETLGYTASAFVLTPADWEIIETTRNTAGNFDLNGPIDRAARRVWGVPVVPSTSLTAGTALALDASAATISTDAGGIETKWSDQSGDLFDKNQLKVRTEGRFSIDVVTPSAIVEISLTEGGS
jgi:HK97 family phage major capsid protein